MAYDQDLLDDVLIAFDKLGWKLIPKDDTASNIWELNGWSEHCPAWATVIARRARIRH